MKKLLAILLILALVFSFAACGGSSEEEESAGEVAGNIVDGDTIYVGVFEPTTGENGGGGMQEVLGIRYANTMYPTIDINGTTYNIELVEVDNQSDKAAAVTAAQNLISNNVVAVLGSYGSGVSIAAGETFASAGVPAVGCSCTNPQVTLGNDFYFRVCFLDPFQGMMDANYAISEGYETAVIISQNGDDYSTGLANYFKASFEELGGTIVGEEVYQTNESDFNAILTNVKAAAPDVIFCPSSIATATLILPQIKAMGIESLVLAGDTWQNSAIISENAVGVVFSTFFSESKMDDPIVIDFAQGFKAYLNADPQNLTWNSGNDTVAAVSALGYDSYMAVYNAMLSLDGQELENINSVAIRDALVGVQFEGSTGAIAFDENGDVIKEVVVFETVTEDSVATKSFQFLKDQTATDL